MKYIEISGAENYRTVPFWFAVEEYVAKHWLDDDYFVMWQVDPCVMVGRNQLIDNEVNVDFCRQNNIAITRRKSGGGCIYSDSGCILFSYINRASDVASTFERHMRDTARTLEAIGINASLSGRNDLLVDGKKVAGAAIYRCANRVIMHNSLLFSTDFATMQQAITPSRAKLQSKGVVSVSQRVGNVADHTSMPINAYIAEARRVLCGEAARRITDSELQAIKEIEKNIASDAFIYGSNPSYSIVRKARLEGVGTIEASVELHNNAVQATNFTGDYFLLGDIDGELFAPMKGSLFTREAITHALEGVCLDSIIRGLTLKGLLDLLFPAEKMPSSPQRKPVWLKMQAPVGEAYQTTKRIISEHNLHTICQSGLCPNRAECWRNSTATFMIGGDICTRRCRFCNTLTGRPHPLDPDEPARVAESIRLMGLHYAVITSVDRDDLPDLGANHWAHTVQKVREVCPKTKVEVLIPDFQGRHELIDVILKAAPDVVGHNMETTARLTPSVRSVAKYEQSLDVLSYIEMCGFNSKTGFMLGLGETDDEVLQLLKDVRATGCRRITIGQYLQPTHNHLPVARYYTPEEFARYRVKAIELGFTHAVSGPLVRSSYHAEQGENG
ncbi:MAG: lipoyl synthase [Bacteroidales bacterium]|nr:lipoyl synthase [Bacteroidales bacterium]